jgi:hypothetical protein
MCWTAEYHELRVTLDSFFVKHRYEIILAT